MNDMTNARVVMIGGGKMGEAMAAGWLATGTLTAGNLAVVEPSESRRAQLSLGETRVVADAGEVLPANVVVLAVKPQVLEAVIGGLGENLAGVLVVSVAAGISTARIESLLSGATAVVRVMPNTPAMVGEGMAVVSGGSEASDEQVEYVRGLFAALGDAITVEERYQNAAGAISGSGPAYFALVIDALARAGVAAGLPRAVAQRLAVQTMAGTAKLLDESGMHPEELVDGVTSPGGTTIAALTELEAAGLRAAFVDAVAAAVHRSEELGS